MSHFRNICITWNNYKVEDIQYLRGLVPGTLVYLIYGKEGEKKTKHLQVYAELVKQTRFARLKELFPKIHFEKRYGTQAQAITYCKKEGKFKELGVARDQGSRVDLDGMRVLADEEGMRAVVRRGNAQQIRVAQMYLTYCEEERDWEPNVIWLWGPSGSGKSLKAAEMCKDLDTYYLTPPSGGTVWFDGYDKHEAMIINEASPDWLPFDFLKTLLDSKPCRLPIKGGFRQCLATLIILTSVKPPHILWADPNGELERRVKETIGIGVTEVIGNTNNDLLEESDDE